MSENNRNQGRQESFKDWSALKNSRYQHTNEEIIKHFGNPIDKPDTNNATVIRYDKDSKPKYSLSARQYWKKLALYNSGVANLEWTNGPYITYQINKHLIEGLMDKLELTPSQRTSAYRYFMGLDLSAEGVHAELVAFCVCAVLVHQDDSPRTYHPNQSEKNKDALFVELEEKLGIPEKRISSVYRSREQAVKRGITELNTDYRKFEKRALVVPAEK